MCMEHQSRDRLAAESRSTAIVGIAENRTAGDGEMRAQLVHPAGLWVEPDEMRRSC